MSEKPPTYATAKTFTPPSEKLFTSVCPYCNAPLIDHATVFHAELLALLYKQFEAAVATSENGMTDVTIRFKNGRARWIGVQTWEEAEK